MDGGSSCEIIYESCFEKLNPTIKATKVHLKTPLVGLSGEHSWSVGEVPLEITIRDAPFLRTETLNFVNVRFESLHNMLLGRTVMKSMGIVVSTIHGAIKFHTEKGIRTVLSIDEANQGTKRAKRIRATSKEMVLSSLNVKEKIIVNDKGLGPDRSMAACKKIVELTKEGILRKAKHQTWVSNPVMVKKSDGGWRMCMDFTDINKACPKDCYPLPEIDWKIKSLLGFRLKCFLDVYKGYHQIQMVEEDEDKTAFYAREGVLFYKKMPFGLKNAGATYQRLVDKVFSHQIR
nr:hypothetical protein [Tanacetum cinerariifolium]